VVVRSWPVIVVGALAAACVLSWEGAVSAALLAAGDLLPITIPPSTLPVSVFASKLQTVCGSLAPGSAARNYLDANPIKTTDADSSAISALSVACQKISSGQPLNNTDLNTLETFRQNPAAAIQQLNRHLPATNAVSLQGSASGALLSGGSLDAVIINGLSQFIYDRAKDEATAYLDQLLTEKLCAPTPKLFLPSMCMVLADNNSSVSLGAIGSYLAAAAHQDLVALPDRVLAYALKIEQGKGTGTSVEQGKGTGTSKSVVEALFAARLGLTYYTAVAAGRTPLDVARSMHMIALPAGTPGQGTEVLAAVQVASDVVDAVQAQQGWQTVTALNSPAAPFYALGVLLSLQDDLTPPAGGRFQLTKVEDMVPVVARIVADVAMLEQRTQAAADARVAAATAAVAAATPSATTGNFVIKAMGATDSTKLSAGNYMVVATQVLQDMLTMGVTLAPKLNVTAPPATVTQVATVFQLGEQIISGASPGQILILANQLVATLDTSAPGLGDISRLLALVAQIAQAKSADEVQAVLETAAAPATSYRDKYKRPVVAIGAMAGVTGGWEKLRTEGSWAGVAGPFAPVGFTFSYPPCQYVHLGLMLSVIDLGALVSTRFSQDVNTTNTAPATTPATMMTMTVEAEPQPKWQNVFAPGLFFNVGIGGSPFTLSLGGRVIPTAREIITTASGTGTSSPASASSTSSSVQLIAALSVDVPFFVF
jgi:hypothetical protein